MHWTTQALSVEFIHIGEAATTGSKNELESFMLDRGYTVRAMVTNRLWLANDYIFVKKGFREDILLKDIHTGQETEEKKRRIG